MISTVTPNKLMRKLFVRRYLSGGGWLMFSRKQKSSARKNKEPALITFVRLKVLETKRAARKNRAPALTAYR
jgi:hypothetical protein